jgi:hypothetical protein
MSRLEDFVSNIGSYGAHGVMRRAFGKVRDVNRMICGLALWLEEIEDRVQELEKKPTPKPVAPAPVAKKVAVKKPSAKKR